MRYVLGQTFNHTRPADPTPPPPPPHKPDVPVSITPLVGNVLTVNVPPYDLAVNSKLCDIRAYLIPAGDPPLADAAAFIASSHAFVAADVSAVQTGAAVDLTLPDVPAGDYVGQILLGYED